jgi:MOSC domain-containing protein YiiM
MSGAMTASLLSVNAGVPREVEWNGGTVRTPTGSTRWTVRRINIEGDDQADRLAHGGEHRRVFVHQIDS